MTCQMCNSFMHSLMPHYATLKRQFGFLGTGFFYFKFFSLSLDTYSMQHVQNKRGKNRNVILFFFSVMTNDISNSKSLYVHIFCVLTRHQTLLCIRDSGTFTYVVVSREISLSVGYTFCYLDVLLFTQTILWQRKMRILWESHQTF